MIGRMQRLDPNATVRIPRVEPSMDRFFCPDIADGRRVTLDESESNHLTRVLRHQIGDIVELFDGHGRSAPARLIETARRAATLELSGEVEHEALPEISLTLGVAPPKGERLRWLVEKATELGVTAIVPLICERSVVEPRETKLLKLEQSVIAACKQCRRNRLMEIRSPSTPSEFLSTDVASIRLIADRNGRRLVDSLEGLCHASIRCAIGPEGGFSAAELESASTVGATPVSLGRNVLRVETAAIAMAAAILISSLQNGQSAVQTGTR
jgi:16S rRNA (uracil1498-N3)-methyltransferase